MIVKFEILTQDDETETPTKEQKSKINRALATFKGPGSDREVLLKMFEILIQDDETETPTKEQK
jgi:hypothetical protein